MTFVCNGLIFATCCPYTVLPHPALGLNAFDCANNPVPVNPWTSFIDVFPICLSCSVPTEETTWGQIKSMYQ